MAEYGIGGGLNTFVPTFSPATGQIQVEFTRSVNRFPITQYAQIVPVTQMSGYFLRIDEEEAARVVSVQDQQWALGEDRPTGINTDFEFTQFTTQRFQASFAIPNETVKQASWDLVASHARIQAAKMMSHRTYRAASILTTAANYNGGAAITSYVSTNTAGFYNKASYVNNLTNGITGTDGVQVLFRSACEKIMQATNGVVGPKDIIAVMNPATARILASTEAVREYVRYSPNALAFLQGDATFSAYGLPQNLFGVGGIVVDDTVTVSTRKGGVGTKAFFYGTVASPAIAFVARPNGLVANEGPTFSTLTVFAYEDMTVETLDDPWNRRIRGSVVDNSAVVMTAPLTALYVADITS